MGFRALCLLILAGLSAQAQELGMYAESSFASPWRENGGESIHRQSGRYLDGQAGLYFRNVPFLSPSDSEEFMQRGCLKGYAGTDRLSVRENFLGGGAYLYDGWWLDNNDCMPLPLWSLELNYFYSPDPRHRNMEDVATSLFIVHCGFHDDASMRYYFVGPFISGTIPWEVEGLGSQSLRASVAFDEVFSYTVAQPTTQILSRRLQLRTDFDVSDELSFHAEAMRSWHVQQGARFVGEWSCAIGIELRLAALARWLED